MVNELRAKDLPSRVGVKQENEKKGMYLSAPISSVETGRYTLFFDELSDMAKGITTDDIVTPLSNGVPADASPEQHYGADMVLQAKCRSTFFHDAISKHYSMGCRLELMHAIYLKHDIYLRAFLDSIGTLVLNDFWEYLSEIKEINPDLNVYAVALNPEASGFKWDPKTSRFVFHDNPDRTDRYIVFSLKDYIKNTLNP